MAIGMFHPDSVAGSAAARTNSGKELVIQWPDFTFENYSYAELTAAKQRLVADGIAKEVSIPNGYGGFDNALFKL